MIGTSRGRRSSPADVEAVHVAGQADVEDDELRMAITNVFQAPLAVLRLVHPEPGLPKIEVDQIGDVRIVLDEDDGRRIRGHNGESSHRCVRKR